MMPAPPASSGSPCSRCSSFSAWCCRRSRPTIRTVWQQFAAEPQSVPRIHWFGTTDLGQDTFWLLTWATRNSLHPRRLGRRRRDRHRRRRGSAPRVSPAASSDRVLAFLMDVFICIPSLPILILFAVDPEGRCIAAMIAIILVVFNWPFPGAADARGGARHARTRVHPCRALLRRVRAAHPAAPDLSVSPRLDASAISSTPCWSRSPPRARSPSSACRAPSSPRSAR